MEAVRQPGMAWRVGRRKRDTPYFKESGVSCFLLPLCRFLLDPILSFPVFYSSRFAWPWHVGASALDSIGVRAGGEKGRIRMKDEGRERGRKKSKNNLLNLNDNSYCGKGVPNSFARQHGYPAHELQIGCCVILLLLFSFVFKNGCT